MLQYVQDWDETYPLFCYGGTDPATAPYGAPFWPTLVMPYVKSTKVFKCPSQAKSPSPTYGDVNSYGVNSNIFGFAAAGQPVVTMAQVNNPAATILTYDDIGNWAWIDLCNWNPYFSGNCDARHSEGCNLSFCDGHVKWMKTSASPSAYSWQVAQWNL